MTLSRTSRILLGFLLLALASFLWVNYFIQGPGLSATLLRAAPAPSAGTEPAIDTPDVAPVGEPAVARDFEVLDLPFLVTQPPEQAQPSQPRAAEADGTTTEAPTARRATVNPFAPIIRAGPAPVQPTAQTEQPAAPAVVTEVPVPRAPSPVTQRAVAPEPAPKAPAPRPVAPETTASTSLPRALPGGTLGTGPQVLRRAIGTPITPQQGREELAEAREPVQEPPAPQPQEPIAESSEQESVEPQPLEQPIAEAPREVPMEGGPPLVAGTSPLSRYLRDNDVRFTGSVIGPVSVGVFRSATTQAPIVISLGQTLPETSIVLTDLRGQQAELTLEDNSQILTLELRR